MEYRASLAGQKGLAHWVAVSEYPRNEPTQIPQQNIGAQENRGNDPIKLPQRIHRFY